MKTRKKTIRKWKGKIALKLYKRKNLTHFVHKIGDASEMHLCEKGTEKKIDISLE